MADMVVDVLALLVLEAPGQHPGAEEDGQRIKQMYLSGELDSSIADLPDEDFEQHEKSWKPWDERDS